MIPNAPRPVIPLSRDEYYREVTRLRDRVATLEEEKRALVEVFAPRAPFPAAWRLTHSERTVLGALAAAHDGFCSHDALYMALYGFADDVNRRIIDQFIMRLRNKLRPYMIAIESVWGDGFRLPPESLARVRAAIAALTKETT